MTPYKFLYHYLLPPLFKMQDNTSLFTWIPILGDLIKIKQRAIDQLKLQKGDKVLVYSIGAGFEIDFIMDKIGEDGFIVGVDFSKEMLNLAQEKVNKNNWSNVKLVLVDVREYDPVKDNGYKFDAALSNFGYLDKTVLDNLIAALRKGGRIAVSCPQPLRGIRKIFYPITFVPEMAFGLTWKSLNSVPVRIETLKRELNNLNIDENTFAKYFVAVSGTKR